MNITATNYVKAEKIRSKYWRQAIFFIPILSLLSGCVSGRFMPVAPGVYEQAVNGQQTPSATESSNELFVPIPSSNDAKPAVLPDLSQAKNPKAFALHLVDLMGASPGKCGVAAKNSPHVNWTCAEYTQGLSTFITEWDKLIQSAEVSLSHSYQPTSEWMYFEIDGEIDFFWKTYDLDTTQALVAYDPSEKGNELIIGLNPTIGNQIAAANGSHSFSDTRQPLPVQE